MRYVVTNEILEYISTRLDDNISMMEIAREIDCGRTKLHKIVTDHWPEKVKRNHYRISRDSYYFSAIDTPEKAYWLGLLYADGSLYEDSENRLPAVNLGLQESDRYILEQLQADLQYGGSLYKHRSSIRGKSHISYNFQIKDQRIFDDLRSAGMAIGKTNRVFPTEEQVPRRLIWHFLRGLLDGDGCIGKHICQTRIDYDLSFTGPYAIVNSIADFLGMQHLTLADHYKPEANCFTLSIGGNRQIYPILENLYAGATRKLKRKYQRYLEYKEYYNTHCRAI